MVKIEILQQKGYNFLYIDDYLWMWDIPQEVELQKELAKKAYGDVLVVGYGLGIVQKFLSKNPKVESITTIEKFKEVVEKCEELLGGIHGKIIIEELDNYSEKKKFDCIIGDIWPDISAIFLKDYIKFKNKAQKLLKDNGKILAWGQEFFEYLLKKNQKEV